MHRVLLQARTKPHQAIARLVRLDVRDAGDYFRGWLDGGTMPSMRMYVTMLP